MKKSLRFIIILLFIFAFFSCGSGSNETSNSGTVVKYIDKGGVVPDPIYTTVTISSETIEYEESQSDIILEEWSAEIDSSDYNSVKQIVDFYNLIQMDDIMLDEGEEPCTGSRGMTISITETDNDASNTHSFEITPDAACGDNWPEGVRALVDQIIQLAEVYQ